MSLTIRQDSCALDFLALGAVVHRLDPGIIPFRKARSFEIHVSGGSDSDGAWLKSGAVLRLDAHDNAVPEEVWHLLERVVPLCANLRGVTLERMEGTVEERDVANIEEENSVADDASNLATASSSGAHTLTPALTRTVS